jgi:molecular chaperone DnaK (HSP70)
MAFRQPKQARKPVRVTFNLDLDGVLTATARVVSRGATAMLNVTKTGHFFSAQRVERTLVQVADEKKTDE